MRLAMRKRDFAEMLGINPYTVNLFINDGMPVLKPTHNMTLIDLREAELWLSEQASPMRQKLREIVTKIIINNMQESK